MKRFALLGALIVAAPAAAAAPRADLAALRDGTAIVRFSGERSTFAATLRRAGLGGVLLRKLPFAAVNASRAELVRLARRGAVRAVRMDRRVIFDSSSARGAGGGTASAAAADDTLPLYNGSGVNVAVVDTGADGLHPDLADRVVRNLKVLDARGLADDVELPSAPQYLVCPVACTTDTSGGHGTHVSSIAVGDGTASAGRYGGVAPGAGLVGISIGDGATTFYALQAWDYLLANPGLGVVAVNNSYGPGGGPWDARDPMNVASRKLHDAGIAVVFSGGNAGPGPGTNPAGASNCAPTAPAPNPLTGSTCKTNPWGLSPWSISVGNGRADRPGGRGEQPIAFGASRGDPAPQRSVDGAYTIDYRPLVIAPGTNVIAARALNGAAQFTCGASAEPASCTSIAPEHLPFYVPMSGSSMAAPQVLGAIAVIQQAAKAELGRLLEPDEVKALLADTATPMTAKDLMWDWPFCPDLQACGTVQPGLTGKPYQPWQVGAGYLDVAAAVAEVQRRAIAP